MRKSIKKGDVVKYYPSIKKASDKITMERYAMTGLVLTTKKKEVSRNKNKFVVEIVIAHTADIMWDAGDVESDVPIEHLELISRG